MAASSSYSNPMFFRLGEECRHFNFHNVQDMAHIKAGFATHLMISNDLK